MICYSKLYSKKQGVFNTKIRLKQEPNRENIAQILGKICGIPRYMSVLNKLN